MSGDGWSQRAGRRVACVGIGSRRGVCSALASQRSLSLGHAGQGAMAPSCSRSRYLTALGVSRVSMLRSRVCVAAIDRGARSASVRAVLPWSWRGGPHPLMARPPPPTFIRHWRGGPHPLMARPPPPTFKYVGVKNPEVTAVSFAVTLSLDRAPGPFRFLAGDQYGKGKSIRDER